MKKTIRIIVISIISLLLTASTVQAITLWYLDGTTLKPVDDSWSINVSGVGNVTGPASATDNAIVRFNLTTGKIIQNSVVTIADTTGNMAGVGTFNTHTIPGGTGTLALTSDISGSATIALDNLVSVAINTSLLPGTAEAISLGSTTKEWGNLYVGDAGKIYLGLGQDASIYRNAADEMTLIATSGVTVEGVKIDGGVITGASSITSTALVGDVTGNCSGSSGSCTGEAATVATINGLAPNTATTQATQASITTCSNLVTVGALDSGSITSGFGTIATGDSISGTTLTATAASSLTLGTASTTIGGIIFKNATNANTVTIQSGATSGTYALTLPLAIAGAGEVLTDAAGDGVLSWAAAGAGDVVSVGDCTDGACFDGTSDGGTNITFYNIDSNKTQLIASDTASDLVITLPATTGQLALLDSPVFTTAFTATGLIGDEDLQSEDFGEFTCAGEDACTIDDSVAVTNWNLTTPTITTSIDLPAGAINTATEIAADIITHTQIADADQTDTKCLWFEDPTAADDFTSIWRNGTANAFLITEIWGESDQTVNFDLVEGAGDCGDPVIPAAGEDENTGLSCTISADEEIDLKINSVTNTPTWVSICFTGNWVD